MEDLTEYITAFAAGVIFCIAVWLLFAQCRGVFAALEGGSARSFEVMYVP